MEFETFTTENMILRKLTPLEYKYVFENYPENELKLFLGIDSDNDFIKEKKKYLGGYTTYRTTILHFQLIDKETQNVLGLCGYHNWYAEHRRAELGYRLLKESYKGRGFMTEALKYIIPYGFDAMNLNRMEALISPANIPSLKLVKRHNFIQEGLLKQHFFVEGKMVDSLLFALLRENYEENKNPGNI